MCLRLYNAGHTGLTSFKIYCVHECICRSRGGLFDRIAGCYFYLLSLLSYLLCSDCVAKFSYVFNVLSTESSGL